MTTSQKSIVYPNATAKNGPHTGFPVLDSVPRYMRGTAASKARWISADSRQETSDTVRQDSRIAAISIIQRKQEGNPPHSNAYAARAATSPQQLRGEGRERKPTLLRKRNDNLSVVGPLRNTRLRRQRYSEGAQWNAPSTPSTPHVNPTRPLRSRDPPPERGWQKPLKDARTLADQPTGTASSRKRLIRDKTELVPPSPRNWGASTTPQLRPARRNNGDARPKLEPSYASSDRTRRLNQATNRAPTVSPPHTLNSDTTRRESHQLSNRCSGKTGSRLPSTLIPSARPSVPVVTRSKSERQLPSKYNSTATRVAASRVIPAKPTSSSLRKEHDQKPYSEPKTSVRYNKEGNTTKLPILVPRARNKTEVPSPKVPSFALSHLSSLSSSEILCTSRHSNKHVAPACKKLPTPPQTTRSRSQAAVHARRDLLALPMSARAPKTQDGTGGGRHDTHHPSGACTVRSAVTTRSETPNCTRHRRVLLWAEQEGVEKRLTNQTPCANDGLELLDQSAICRDAPVGSTPVKRSLHHQCSTTFSDNALLSWCRRQSSDLMDFKAWDNKSKQRQLIL